MYRLFTTFAEPYTVLIIALLVILIAVKRGRQAADTLLINWAITITAILCVFSLPIVGDLAEGSLEWSFPPSSVVPTADDTLVVLAANAVVSDNDGTAIRLGDETLLRCLHALKLYEQSGGCRVIVSGGRLRPTGPTMTLAEAMRKFLATGGVPPHRIVIEAESTTTFENARNTSRLLRSATSDVPRVFLVTSATHMRRASRCFAHEHVQVIAAPCSHHVLKPEIGPHLFIPCVTGLLRFQTAEWLGLIWYRLLGRI